MQLKDMQLKDMQVKKALLWLCTHRGYPQDDAYNVGIKHRRQREGAQQHSRGESNAHVS